MRSWYWQQKKRCCGCSVKRDCCRCCPWWFRVWCGFWLLGWLSAFPSIGFQCKATISMKKQQYLWHAGTHEFSHWWINICCVYDNVTWHWYSDRYIKCQSSPSSSPKQGSSSWPSSPHFHFSLGPLLHLHSGLNYWEVKSLVNSVFCSINRQRFQTKKLSGHFLALPE